MNKYLRENFPGVDESELNNSRVIRTAEEIMRMKEICLECNGKSCALKGRAIPFLEVWEDRWGQKHVEVRMTLKKDCRYKILDEELFASSGLKEWQREQTFEAFEGSTKKVKQALREQLNVNLSGETGIGKTHLAVAMMLETMREGHRALFYPVGQMLDDLREGGGGYFDLMRKLKTVPLLVLDDFGIERETAAGLEYLYQIIDARYRARLQTVITTNALNPDELLTPTNVRIMKAVLSRLLEHGMWVMPDGKEDWRLS